MTATAQAQKLKSDSLALNLAKTIYREGFDEGDSAKVLSIFDDGFCDMSSAGPSFWGPEAGQVMKARLDALFRDYEARMVVIIIDFEFYGDVALDYGWHELTLVPKNGGATRFVRTRYFEMWRRDATRGWVITKFFDNADQQPELADSLIARLNSPRQD